MNAELVEMLGIAGLDFIIIEGEGIHRQRTSATHSYAREMIAARRTAPLDSAEESRAVSLRRVSTERP